MQIVYGLRIGTPQGVKVVFTSLMIWGVTGLTTIIAEIAVLRMS